MHRKIKKKMEQMGVTQVDMILELQKQNVSVTPQLMSSILRGVVTYPKAQEVLKACELILEKREYEQ